MFLYLVSYLYSLKSSFRIRIVGGTSCYSSGSGDWGSTLNQWAEFIFAFTTYSILSRVFSPNNVIRSGTTLINRDIRVRVSLNVKQIWFVPSYTIVFSFMKGKSSWLRMLIRWGSVTSSLDSSRSDSYSRKDMTFTTGHCMPGSIGFWGWLIGASTSTIGNISDLASMKPRPRWPSFAISCLLLYYILMRGREFGYSWLTVGFLLTIEKLCRCLLL